MSKIGFQGGGSVINQLGKLCDRHPVNIKLYSLALNTGVAQFIHDRGISLTLRNIGRGLDYGWDGDIVAKANAVADAHIAALSPFLPYDPHVECHNEPPTWDIALTTQENIDRAKRGNEWQVIVGDRLHAAGFKHVLAYSFSVGTPKSTIYGDELNMWPYYQDGIAHCDGLALHEYWKPGPLPQFGLTYRYRLAYQQMLAKRPIMLTELGLGFDAGYQAYTNLDGYLSQLDQYDAELMQDNYLLCAHIFLLSSDSAQWATWDVQSDSEYETKFIPWLKSGSMVVPSSAPSVSTSPSPSSSPSPSMPPSGETMIPYQAYKLPQSLADHGWQGQPGDPSSSVEANDAFYRLQPMAGFLSGVSAFVRITVLDQYGHPANGVKVVNDFGDGTGELAECDSTGTVQFNFGTTSAFTPPAKPPLKFYIVDARATRDVDKPHYLHYTYKLSDIVYGGDTNGEHTEGNLTFIAQVLLPVATNINDAIRFHAYPAKALSIPVYNPNAALQSQGRTRKMGAVLTDEFYESFGRTDYVAQGFATGILATIVGHYADNDFFVIEW